MIIVFSRECRSDPAYLLTFLSAVAVISLQHFRDLVVLQSSSLCLLHSGLYLNFAYRNLYSLVHQIFTSI